MRYIPVPGLGAGGIGLFFGVGSNVALVETAVGNEVMGLSLLANRIKGLGQGGGAVVEIALAERNGQRILVAGLNSSARWSPAQLRELRRLGIEIAPQTARGMRMAPHAEENIAAHLHETGATGVRWSRAVVGTGSRGSYVCHNCRNMVSRAGGTIEEGIR